MIIKETGSPRQPPKNVRSVKIALRESVQDFIAANAIPLTKSQPLAGFYIDPDRTSDTSPFRLEGLIAITFEDGPQGFTLPPGRSLIVSQQAGVVQDFTMTLFDEPKPFDEARRFVKDLVGALDRKGWDSDGAIMIPASAADLDATGTWTSLASMTDAQGNRFELTMIDYGLAPKQESWITVPLGRSDTASHTYLVQVSIYQPSGATVGYGEAVYPRRLFVNKSKNVALPLRAWIDDPTWSPAAHGMVPTPAAERAGEASYWQLPR